MPGKPLNDHEVHSSYKDFLCHSDTCGGLRDQAKERDANERSNDFGCDGM